jgi:flagellar biosynthetic protein FliQ
MAPRYWVHGEEFLLAEKKMNPEHVVQIAKEAIEITLYVSLPIMGVGLLVGLIISLFQAVTQIHEMTLLSCLVSCFCFLG